MFSNIKYGILLLRMLFDFILRLIFIIWHYIFFPFILFNNNVYLTYIYDSCGRWVVFSRCSGFLHYQLTDTYNWNIVESGVKHLILTLHYGITWTWSAVDTLLFSYLFSNNWILSNLGDNTGIIICKCLAILLNLQMLNLWI